MPTYPSSPLWSYPVVRRLEFATKMAVAKNGTEQRWMGHTGKESWDLTYPHLTLAQRDTLLAAFETAVGSAGTFDFVFLGTTFTGCYFDDDKLSVVESNPTQRALSVKICQTNRVADSGVMPSDFPLLAPGNYVQLPYTYERSFDTVAVMTEGGRSAYSKRSASLRAWGAGGSVITDDEADDIWDMFRLAGGKYRSFGFTDPDSLTHYASCRFAADTIERRMLGPNHNAIQVAIQQLV